MKNLVHAELLKLRTTRSFYGNALAVLAFVPLFVAIAIQTAGGEGVAPRSTPARECETCCPPPRRAPSWCS